MTHSSNALHGSSPQTQNESIAHLAFHLTGQSLSDHPPRSWAPNLLDRDRDTAAIDALMAASHDSAGMLVITGKPGFGKTALLHAALTHARRTGFAVRMARGDLTNATPLALVRRLIEPELPDVEPIGACGAPGSESTATGLEATPPTSAPGELDEYQSTGMAEHNQLYRSVAKMAETQPLMLVIDDVDWADRASLIWLSKIPIQLAGTPIAVLVARGQGRPCRNLEAFEDLLAASNREVLLTPLTKSGITALLKKTFRTQVDDNFATKSFAVTLGNPAVLTGLSSALFATGLEPKATNAELVEHMSAPQLLPVLNAWLRQVSSQGPVIAHVVAVLGGDATLERIRDLAGLDTLATADLADVLCRTGLFQVTRNRLGHVYPLLQQTCAADLPAISLRALHAQAAQLLWQTGAEASRVAEQLLSAAPLNQSWVIDVLTDAADAALATGDPINAAAYLNRALSEPCDEVTRATLLASQGNAETYTDLYAAMQHLSEAVAANMGNDSAFQLADLLVLLGKYRQAHKLIRSIASESSKRDPTEDSIPDDWSMRLTEIELYHLDTAPGAVDRLSNLVSSHAEVTIDSSRGSSLFAATIARNGASRRDALRHAYHALSINHNPRTTHAHVRAALVLAQAGNPAEAYDRLDTILASAQRWEHRPLRAATLSARSIVARNLGALPSGLEDASTAVDLLLNAGSIRCAGATVMCLARLIDALVDTGKWEEATTALESVRLTEEVKRSAPATALLVSRGRLQIATGQTAAGIQDLQRAGKNLTEWRINNPAVVAWRTEIALGLIRRGEPMRAKCYARDELALARRWGAPGPVGISLRVLAEASDGSFAAELLAESVEILRSTPYRLALAESLVAYGAAQSSISSATAHEAVQEGLQLAQQCQSAPLITTALHALAETNQHINTTSRKTSGIETLTRAERQNADLAAAGATNAEIAKKLYVQRRTVELHLTNVYRKLGITGRRELVALMHDHYTIDTRINDLTIPSLP